MLNLILGQNAADKKEKREKKQNGNDGNGEELLFML